MTENKRFTLHINWFNKEKTEGEALLKDNGQPLLETERINDARLLKNILNELYDENNELRQELNCEKPLFTKKRLHQQNQQLTEENEQLKSTINTLTCDNTKMKKVLNTTKKENEYIKNTIKEAYETERTDLGKSVLKQLMEAI